MNTIVLPFARINKESHLSSGVNTRKTITIIVKVARRLRLNGILNSLTLSSPIKHWETELTDC